MNIKNEKKENFSKVLNTLKHDKIYQQLANCFFVYCFEI